MVKIVVAEDGSDAMTEFYYSTGHKEKIVSAMAALEVRSALNRLRREGAISAEAVSSVMEFLTAEIRQMNEQPVIAPVLEIAADLLDQRSLRALDALQLATAISVREQGEDEIRFIASDKTLLQAAELEGFQIWNPLGVD